MLEVAGLSKAYGTRVAVNDLSFRVSNGEILGLVGANGAGKTTTLLALAGVLTPDAGRIMIGDHDIAVAPIQAKQQVGFVPDEPQLFDYLTVEEHLRFIGRLYGVRDIETRLPALLADLELTDRARSLPDQLSRGMRQKLTLGCALIHDPTVLLLDEPLTGLDPLGMRRTKDLILRRAAAGAAVLLSSHLLGLVSELCTRVVVLGQGRAIAVGAPAEIAARRSGGNLEDAVIDLISE